MREAAGGWCPSATAASRPWIFPSVALGYGARSPWGGFDSCPALPSTLGSVCTLPVFLGIDRQKKAPYNGHSRRNAESTDGSAECDLEERSTHDDDEYRLILQTFMAEDTPQYQQLLEYIVKSLVDNPNDVKVERKVDEMGVLLSLKVHSQDMGQIVGRQGSTARAIRTLVRIAGLKAHARVNLKIEEPDGGRGPRKPEEPLGDLNI